MLRAEAAFDALLGVVLFLATWDGLYSALGLPTAGPAVYTQVSGALLVALAYVLWLAADDVRFTRRIAGATAVVHALSAVLVVGWRLVTDLDVGLRGTTILGVLAAVLTGLALLAAGVAARPALGGERAL